MVTHRAHKQQVRAYAQETGLSYAAAQQKLTENAALRTGSSSHAEVTLIFGFTGVGKSFLLQELYDSSEAPTRVMFTHKSDPDQVNQFIEAGAEIYIDELPHVPLELHPSQRYFIIVHSGNVAHATHVFSTRTSSPYIIAEVHEAFRADRNFFTRTHTPTSASVFPVVSFIGGAGKTVTAMRLAAALANAGHSTLLIDGDFRDGQIRYLTSGTKSSPSVMDLPYGDESSLDLHAAVTAAAENLDLLYGPPAARQTGELTSQDFHKLVEAARSSYDYVVIDTGASQHDDILKYAIQAATRTILVTQTANEEHHPLYTTASLRNAVTYELPDVGEVFTLPQMLDGRDERPDIATLLNQLQ